MASTSRWDIDPETLQVTPRKKERPKTDTAGRLERLRTYEDDRRAASKTYRR